MNFEEKKELETITNEQENQEQNIVNEQEKQEQETAIKEDVKQEEGDKNPLEEMRDEPSMSLRTNYCWCESLKRPVPCNPFICP